MKAILLSIWLYTICTVVTTWAQLPVAPHIEWQTVSSLHFEVIYPKKHSAFAVATLNRLEFAFEQLQHSWQPPSRKIPVVIRLDTDLPNGYATILPYPHIVIFPLAPPLQESIGEYSDWLYELCLHELIHIFTFEQRHGLAKGLFYVFGNILTPNILLPRWWLEGVAVDGESLYSEAGRMRSYYQHGFIRALQNEPKWTNASLASINEFRVNEWPYGNRPYLYGALLWNELSQTKKTSFGGDIHRTTGGRLPYLLSSPIAQHSDFEDLDLALQKTKESIHQKVEAQKQALQVKPLSTPEVVTSNKWVEAHNPSLSYDGKKLLFLVRLKDLGKGLILVERDSPAQSFDITTAKALIGELDDLGSQSTSIPLPDSASASTIQRVSWMPNSNSFVYDLVSPANRFEMRSDVWLYDLKTKKAKRLTRNLGAREPSVSPKGDKIAFVKLNPYGHSLGVLDLKTKAIQTWYFKKDSDLHWPTWVDNQTLVATVKNRNQEDLWLIRAQGPVQQISSPCQRNRYPEVRSNSLWVTCDLNGVWNIYQITAFGETRSKFEARTHLVSGAQSHAWDPTSKTLWFTQMGTNGFELASLSPTGDLGPLPKISPLFEKDYPTLKIPDFTSSENAAAPPQNYRPWGYLLPQYWIPFIFSSDKSVAYMISTGSADPVGRHAYQANILFDQVTQAVNYNFSYANQTQWAPFQVFALKEVSFLSDPSLLTKIEMQGLAVDLPIWDSPFYQTSLMLLKADRRFLSAESEQLEMRARWSYSFLQGSARYPIPVRGRQLSFEVSKIRQDRDPQDLHVAQVVAQYFHGSPLGYQGVNRWQLRGYYLDNNRATTNFVQTQSWQIGNSQVGAIMRGYVTGAFFAPKLAILNFEHWLPGLRVDKGSSWLSSYFHQIHFGLVSDHIVLDGLAYTHANPGYIRSRANAVYSSLGTETVWDFNLGYHFDIKLVLGYYLRLQSELGPTEGSWNLGFRF